MITQASDRNFNAFFLYKLRHMLCKFFQENVTLIKEINDLRKELKLCRVLIHDMEAAMGQDSRTRKLTGQGTMAAMPAKQAGPLVERELEEKSKVIEMQQVEYAIGSTEWTIGFL